MIKERYVNLEVARLLRDKGFDEGCYGYYYCGKLTFLYDRLNKNSEHTDLLVSAPTQQVAVDWMRTREILITYDLAPIGTTLMIKVYRRGVCDGQICDWVEATTIIRDTLEEAINDALKYALEKLL